MDAECMRHLKLDFARMLGRTVHPHVAALARDGERNLALEIEMVLAAAAHAARAAIWRPGDCAVRVAARETLRRQDEALRGKRVLDAEDGRQLLVADIRDARRT